MIASGRSSARLPENYQFDPKFLSDLGGDEFGAIHRMNTQKELIDFLTRIEATLFTPITIDGQDLLPGASIGVAIYPDNAMDKPTLINNADLAMYRAKSGVSQKVCFYEPLMDEAVRTRRALAKELGRALRENALDIHYQVQTYVATGKIVGYEALLRWNHRSRRRSSPSRHAILPAC